LLKDAFICIGYVVTSTRARERQFISATELHQTLRRGKHAHQNAVGSTLYFKTQEFLTARNKHL